ncbi:hypothetical protein FKM82_018207, partial [Ascaphus truei]
TPQSVEDCLQSALSSLYPPFEVTAPTLLCQVFSVLERTYREDALRYTLEFLIPAKRILQSVQHQACSQYSGFLFFHEGWPLCLGEKILVQLSSLPWHSLKPGDFYLQVVPYLECSPRLVLKCLSQDGSGVQEIVVPESSHSFLFSAEWLNSINKDRSSIRLENCLATAEEKVLRLPWSEVIYPRFIHKEGFIVGRRCPPCPLMPPLECRSPGDGGITSMDMVDHKVNAQLSLANGQEDIETWGGGAVSPMVGSLSGPFLEFMEGEYVELRPPKKVVEGGIESHRDTWASRAKTAPSRKGKKKGHQAWLHPRRPGKVGSLSTLKAGSLDTWEERSCTGGAGDQSKSTGEGQKYWDIDPTDCSKETDLLAEWRKGLDLLQRDNEREVFSGKQAWVSTDCSGEQKEESWEAEGAVSRSCLQEDKSLSKRLEDCTLERDIPGGKMGVPCVESSRDISRDRQRQVSGDNQQHPSTEDKRDTSTAIQRDLVSDSQIDCQLDCSKKFFTEDRKTEDTHEEMCHSGEWSLTRKDRPDGQETSKLQGEVKEDNPAGHSQTMSNGKRLHTEKEKHPVWGQTAEMPHKTGRGRRKKRNKRGRGPSRTEARKGAHKTGQPKTDVIREGPEIVSESKEDEGDKDDSQEKNEPTELETLPQPINQSEEPAPLGTNPEPDEPLSQNPLPQGSPLADVKHLHRDVNWDILESG